MAWQHYLIALGSNVRHRRLGAPDQVLRAGLQALDKGKLKLRAASGVIATAPIGPSRRRYANAAAIVRTRLPPDRMLKRLKRLERRFGRRAGGRRWGPRVLDLDIVLWDGGVFAGKRLTVPHVAFRTRRFVLDPAVRIAPRWRDPLTGLTIAHLRARLTRPHPVRR